jgi:hypothetical protein
MSLQCHIVPVCSAAERRDQMTEQKLDNTSTEAEVSATRGVNISDIYQEGHSNSGTGAGYDSATTLASPLTPAPANNNRDTDAL